MMCLRKLSEEPPSDAENVVSLRPCMLFLDSCGVEVRQIKGSDLCEASPFPNETRGDVACLRWHKCRCGNLRTTFVILPQNRPCLLNNLDASIAFTSSASPCKLLQESLPLGGFSLTDTLNYCLNSGKLVCSARIHFPRHDPKSAVPNITPFLL